MGAVVGAVVGGVASAIHQKATTGSVDIGKVALAAGVGAVAGVAVAALAPAAVAAAQTVITKAAPAVYALGTQLYNFLSTPAGRITATAVEGAVEGCLENCTAENVISNAVGEVIVDLPTELPKIRLARIFEANLYDPDFPLTHLSDPSQENAFVALASDLNDVNDSVTLANSLTLLNEDGSLRKGPFVSLEFDDPGGRRVPEGASQPGFVEGGVTAGGVREWLVPNRKIWDLENVVMTFWE